MRTQNKSSKDQKINKMKKKNYYEPIKSKFEELFKEKRKTHLEITADRHFSNKLKSQIPSNREIVFHFLKEAAPDITGFVKEYYGPGFIVIEIKDETLKLDHIYQTRKYAELFGARFAFLVSTQEIPEEIKRLSKIVFSLLSLPAYKKLVLVQFDKNANQFVDWFEEKSFRE